MKTLTSNVKLLLLLLLLKHKKMKVLNFYFLMYDINKIIYVVFVVIVLKNKI